jgi:hypothetical protein
MEIIIIIAVLGITGYWAYKSFDKEKSDGSHPLDSVTKPKNSWPFPGGEVGEGKIHVKVADVAPVAVAPVAEPAPVLAVDGHGDVQEVKPVKKAPAKKTADKKPAAKKAPAKKKSV